MRWWSDVGALHAGYRSFGQIVVEQNEVWVLPVDLEFTFFIHLNRLQQQRSGQTVEGGKIVEVWRAYRAEKPACSIMDLMLAMFSTYPGFRVWLSG